MFTGTARLVNRFPRSMIAAWTAVVALALVAAIWGFSAGNLFTRMATTESLVPGSQSDVVQLAGASDANARILVSVTGTTAQATQTELAKLRTDVAKVATVNDPLSVAQTFANETATQREKAVREAITKHADDIAWAQERAVSQAGPQLDYLPESQRAGLEKQIRAEAKAQAEKKIADEARKAADAEIAKLKNPARDFASEGGFAVVITMSEPSKEQTVTDALAAFDAAIAPAHARAVSPHLFEDAALSQVTADLVTGETIGLPAALILLIIIFGGLLAAGLPLVTAIVSILIGMGEVWGLTFATTVDSYILNVLSIIGLALSIDYGLLMVSRYREEIARALAQRGLPTDGSERPSDVGVLVSQAVTATILSSGRTIAYSALTIIVSIAGLLTMAPPMIKMIGAGAMLVTFVAVASALTLLPAIVVVLGERLVKPSVLTRIPVVRRALRGVGDQSEDHGVFSRIAAWVHAHPWPVLVGTVAVLAVAALPIGSLQMRSSFIENVPQSSAVVMGYDEIQANYPALRAPEATVLFAKGTTADPDAVAAVPGVSRIGEVRHMAGLDAVDVYVSAADPVGREVTDVVTSLREAFPSADVGGAAAMQADFNHAVISAAPLAIGIMAGSVLILLFLMTGSFVAPIKALIINSFSLIAGMGITTFLFEHGLLGLPVSHGLQTFVVALAFAFGFGLAMDYEVFLLARVKEFWDAGESNDRAVELGLQRSGRIITSAAAIIIAVFVGFIFGDMLAIKQIGVALAIIVFLDATIVRMLLVPAFMTLMGRWNWWAPAWAQKFYEKFRLAG
ncbi:RND superfamily putative drug exporter [Arcanobacterium wilhelmae]|uniref:RND superfamily putative drug exporter n=1 Tax=Arcanobacterium wilhelmae TaxID=1803177 RepID=A0ABT9NA03_9ACTO|nr:MMPL family transporter [Arcanobacterium wilhelmae]MDP9800046.1 RND superfamily putative drug exporter [Arcanobacterium wilhelmae]WFN89541.1 MMPL family transporter [Arcanobacterium wilhelmae]